MIMAQKQKKHNNKKQLSRVKRYKKRYKQLIKKIKPKPTKKKQKKIVKKPLNKKVVKGKQKASFKARKLNKLKKLKIVMKFMVIISILLLIYLINQGINKSNSKEVSSLSSIKDKQKQAYQNCLALPHSNNDNTELINSYINSLNDYFKLNYAASIYYEDFNTGFNYQYQPSKTYYAATTIKMLDAIYLYEKAIQGEINLDQKIKYQAKFQRTYSAGMKKHKVGSQITIRQVINYAISFSDNTAHMMLVDYIGRGTLKAYGLSLGATLTLSGNDAFGQINVADAKIYLKKLNGLFADKKYGDEIKNLFLNADQNYLKSISQDVEVAHKYGNYEIFYNDIGIVFDKNPYYIVILTQNGHNNQEQLIMNIGAKIYDLHQLFTSERATSCHNKVYK